MVSLDWEDCNISVYKRCLNQLGDLNDIFSYFLDIVVTFIMGRVVSRHNQHVRLNLCFYEVQHRCEGPRWDITEVRSPVTGGNFSFFFRIAIRFMATQISVAVCNRAWSVEVVQVDVGNVDCKVSFSLIRISGNLCIQFIYVIVVANAQRLGKQDVLNDLV